MDLSYKIEMFRDALATVMGTRSNIYDEEFDRVAPDFLKVLKNADENKNDVLDVEEWECLQDADSFRQFCESHLIDFNQLSGRINDIFRPIAFKTVPVQNTPKTEVLILWDRNNDGIFDPSQGDELDLLFTEGGCAMCSRGFDRTDMLPYMVKNQIKYSGKTFSGLQEIAQKHPPK